jgi:glycosyltransferase involved in cell wall biosynthesis
LNITHVDLVCIEHEFGIYGGDAGSHILAMMHALQMPIVTTLHTILEKPDPDQLRVMHEIIQLSTQLIVMSEKGKELLIKVYGSSVDKISLIPHGIPDIPFADPNYYKDEFGVAGKQVILTFGLLSPNKGIEYALEALPDILKEYPDTVFYNCWTDSSSFTKGRRGALPSQSGITGKKIRNPEKCRFL